MSYWGGFYFSPLGLLMMLLSAECQIVPWLVICSAKAENVSWFWHFHWFVFFLHFVISRRVESFRFEPLLLSWQFDIFWITRSRILFKRLWQCSASAAIIQASFGWFVFLVAQRTLCFYCSIHFPPFFKNVFLTVVHLEHFCSPTLFFMSSDCLSTTAVLCPQPELWSPSNVHG